MSHTRPHTHVHTLAEDFEGLLLHDAGVGKSCLLTSNRTSKLRIGSSVTQYANYQQKLRTYVRKTDESILL